MSTTGIKLKRTVQFFHRNPMGLNIGNDNNNTGNQQKNQISPDKIETKAS